MSSMLPIVTTAVVATWLVGCGGSAEVSEKPKPAKQVVKARTPAEKVFVQASRAFGDGKWNEAAALFAKAESLDRKMRAAVVNRGIALERAGNPVAARAVYHEALNKDPENAMAAVGLARTLVAVNEIKAAIKVIEAAIKHDRENPELLNMHAGVLRQTKQYAKAAEAARTVLLRDQKNAAAIKTLALIYADQGKLQLAETFFRNALKLNKRDVTIRVNLGLLASKRNDHQLALAQFEEALEVDEVNAVALVNIGSIALRFRDYKRAADHYRRAIGAGMVNCTTESAFGYALQGLHKGNTAVKQLGKAYKLCPKDAELLLTMGMICMEQTRNNKCALKYFKAYTKSRKGVARDAPVRRFIDSLEQQIEDEKRGPKTVPHGDDSADTPSQWPRNET